MPQVERRSRNEFLTQPLKMRVFRSQIGSSRFREQNRQRNLRSKHAAGIVAAEGNDDYLVRGFVLLRYVCGESLATRQACSSLRHRRTGRIEPAKWQNVDLAEQISNISRSQLLLE